MENLNIQDLPVLGKFDLDDIKLINEKCNEKAICFFCYTPIGELYTVDDVTLCVNCKNKLKLYSKQIKELLKNF